MAFVGGCLSMRGDKTRSSNRDKRYKRLMPFLALIAERGLRNKGAMCRMVGGMGDAATHMRNRSVNDGQSFLHGATKS